MNVKGLHNFHQQDSVTLQMSSAAFVSADFAALIDATTLLPKIITATMKITIRIRKDLRQRGDRKEQQQVHRNGGKLWHT